MLLANDIPVAKQLALRQIKYTPKRGFNLKILLEQLLL